MPSANDPKKKRFALTPVERDFNTVGGSLRNPRVVTVRKSGYAYTSIESTLLITENLPLFGAVRQNLKFKYAANPKTGVVGFTATSTTEEGRGYMTVRDEGNSLYFHLGGVFLDYPELRPAGTVECGLDLAEDTNGNPCFVFDIKAGKAKKTVKRKKKGQKKPEEENKKTDPVVDEEEQDDEDEPDDDEDDDEVADNSTVAEKQSAAGQEQDKQNKKK